MNIRSLGPALALVLVAFTLTGCNSYVLQGRVIAGDISYVAVVDGDDPRLDAPGIPGASLRLETDPSRISREVVGETTSGADGTFRIPFKKVGGGVLMYDVGVTVRRDGYQPATLQFRLPPGAKRLLVMMSPGPDRMGDPDADDPLKQYERYR
ncbi:MAG: carboxypeptidase-like regulatory domain-containing protein [Phycisphaerales bacterium]